MRAQRPENKPLGHARPRRGYLIQHLKLADFGEARHDRDLSEQRSTLLRVSRLLGEKFAGTPLAKHFITSQS